MPLCSAHKFLQRKRARRHLPDIATLDLKMNQWDANLYLTPYQPIEVSLLASTSLKHTKDTCSHGPNLIQDSVRPEHNRDFNHIQELEHTCSGNTNQL